ncbi:hypothetical protein IQ256_09280 [cf. Phormidesmis sp. LEGE 11477]|nr:hypothetical protein [cf. Phormidesmis sp. LEGE 11477]
MKDQTLGCAAGIVLGCGCFFGGAAQAQSTIEPPAEPTAPTTSPATELPSTESPAVESEPSSSDEPLNLAPETVEQSPVLQRWLEEIPDVRSDIRNDPSFRTKLQVGYSFFPSSDSTSGFVVSVDDVFIGDTPLTVSADYQQNFRGDRTAYGADLHYYVLPLGSYVNLSPIVGYRHADSADDYSIDGANLGVRFRFVPSRTSAADVTVDQSWVVGDREGLSVTHLNFGYAVTSNLRLSTDLEWQSTADEGDSRVGVNLEWLL